MPRCLLSTRLGIKRILPVGRGKTCRGARAHLHGTALAYVKQVPWELERTEALLLTLFQPRELPIPVPRRCQKDIYTFVKALQQLADMAWLAKPRKS